MILSAELEQHVLMQNEKRDSWVDHDTAERLEQFISDEYQELLQAMDKCMLGDDPYELISEIGDVFYLWTKRKTIQQPIPVEIVEIITETLELCHQLDITPEECTKFKYFRNIYKYPFEFASNGYSESESKRLSKAMYMSLVGGDLGFYYTYMMLGEEL